MNTNSFETKDSTPLSEYLKSKGITEVLKQQWYHTIIENKKSFVNKDFDTICNLVESLAIEGIDGDIVNQTAFTIANDNDIDIAPDKAAKCFMIFSKR